MKKIFIKMMLISTVLFCVFSILLYLYLEGAHFAIYLYLKYKDILLLNHIRNEFPNMIIKSLTDGLLFGFLLSVFYFTTHYLSLKRLKYKDLNNYCVNQTGEIELKCTFMEAFNLCIQSIISIKGKIINQDIDLANIKAKTRMSMKSFDGETIEFNLIRINESLTKIIIKSKPIKQTSLHLDCGKNFENVEFIKRFLERSI